MLSTSTTSETCRGCKFWEVHTQDIATGDCKRYPPQGYPIPDGRGQIGIMSVFPPTQGATSACGEYKPKSLPLVV